MKRIKLIMVEFYHILPYETIYISFTIKGTYILMS